MTAQKLKNGQLSKKNQKRKLKKHRKKKLQISNVRNTLPITDFIKNNKSNTEIVHWDNELDQLQIKAQEKTVSTRKRRKKKRKRTKIAHPQSIPTSREAEATNLIWFQNGR